MPAFPDGTTTTQSDALGRPLTVTEQDGSIKSISYDVPARANNLGNCNDTTDEAGNKRRSCSDALGRLVEVDEPNPGAGPTNAQGSITISGQLASQSGVGAHGAVAASDQVTISGVDRSKSVIATCPRGQICDQTPETLLDTGKVSITINGHEYDYFFGQGVSGDTPATVASGLVNAIQADPARLVNASATGTGGNIVQLTAVTAGAAGNNITVTTGWTWDTVDFGTASPGFTAAANTGTLQNGIDGSAGVTVYDAGTVTLTLNTSPAFVASSPYGNTPGNSTAALVAAALVGTGSTGLNRPGSPVSATVSGSTITITYAAPGTGGDGISFTSSSQTTQTQFTFPAPSFSGSNSALGNGMNTGDVNNQPFVTLYQYDALGNLLCVEQHGNVSGTGCSASPASDASSPWRVRRFTYDSLSRLLTAHNPESGTITYSYDADGNLLQKTSPLANQTGSSTTTISFCYDALHRLLAKGYTNSPTAPQQCLNAPPWLPNPSVVNTYDAAGTIGKLTSLTDQAGSASYGYDTLGRMTSETRIINGVSKGMSYDYNLDGSLKTIHYPSGAAVTYTPDAAGRVLSAVDAGNNINYVTGSTYQADGQLLGFISGNAAAFAGITNTFNYNKRLQPINTSASAPSQTVYSIGYDFHYGAGNNGNVWGITNYKDNTRNQSFTYDLLNRLTSAQNAGTDCTKKTLNLNQTEYWGNSYGYDAWGNLTSKAVTKCSAEHLSAPSLVNNQLSGYGYDAAGNMTTDPTDGGITLSYDQENRIQSTAGYTYTYDADGNRVKKTNGTTGTLYWYMSPGIVAESDLSGTLKSEYVFFDGERVARRDLVAPGGVFYYFSDHLKTASVITDALGNIKSESDYYPWGGELQFLANDSNHYKFTGKERDETGLDYFGARYYSNGLARFITPDWSSTPIPVPYANFGDPQSLNQYSYVRNVPTVKIDPDGHCCDLNDAINFVAGLANAVGSNNALGAGRVDQTTSAGRMGQAVGDAVSTVQGTAEALFGGGVEGAGLVLDATGAGAVLGVPLNVAGAGIIAHGTTTAVVSGIHLSQDSKQGSASAGTQESSKPHGNTAGDQPAELYEKHDANGNFEKHGVSQNASKRYSKKEIGGGTVKVTDRGTRKEMLKKREKKLKLIPVPKTRNRGLVSEKAISHGYPEGNSNAGSANISGRRQNGSTGIGTAEVARITLPRSIQPRHYRIRSSVARWRTDAGV